MGAWFVTRLNSNAVYSVVESLPKKHKNIYPTRSLSWEVSIQFKNARIICVLLNFMMKSMIVFNNSLQNNMTLSAVTIAAIYKER